MLIDTGFHPSILKLSIANCPSDIFLTKIRTDHTEEKTVLTKLIEEYKKIFYIPNKKLTFTNTLKHKYDGQQHRL